MFQILESLKDSQNNLNDQKHIFLQIKLNYEVASLFPFGVQFCNKRILIVSFTETMSSLQIPQ